MAFPQLEKDDRYPTATIETNYGAITAQLFPDIAPITVHNFIRLTEKHYYDGVVFHRVIKNFMIQGGDPTASGRGGESIYGHNFEDEFSNRAFNLRGALSMANAGPNTNSSQFFIVSAPTVEDKMLRQMAQFGYPKEIVDAYSKRGGTPWLDNRHTVFGQVVDGMETVEAIENVATDDNDKPNEDVVIESITIMEGSGDWPW